MKDFINEFDNYELDMLEEKLKKERPIIENMGQIIAEYKAAEGVDDITDDEFTNLFGESTLYPNLYLPYNGTSYYDCVVLSDYEAYLLHNGMNLIEDLKNNSYYQLEEIITAEGVDIGYFEQLSENDELTDLMTEGYYPLWEYYDYTRIGEAHFWNQLNKNDEMELMKNRLVKEQEQELQAIEYISTIQPFDVQHDLCWEDCRQPYEEALEHAAQIGDRFHLICDNDGCFIGHGYFEGYKDINEYYEKEFSSGYIENYEMGEIQNLVDWFEYYQIAFDIAWEEARITKAPKHRVVRIYCCDLEQALLYMENCTDKDTWIYLVYFGDYFMVRTIIGTKCKYYKVYKNRKSIGTGKNLDDIECIIAKNNFDINEYIEKRCSPKYNEYYEMGEQQSTIDEFELYLGYFISEPDDENNIDSNEFENE